MQSFTPDIANEMTYDITDRSNGNPLTVGDVNCYLRAKTGDNAGKYFQASDGTWRDDPSIAGVAVHGDDGHWYATIIASAWISGVKYTTYAKETTDKHVSVSEEVSEAVIVLTPSFEATMGD